MRDMCVNITQHALVPKHEKMTPEQVVDLENTYRISASREEWPIIYTSDKIVQYYNFKENDLIRITRVVGVQEPVYYYRLVRCAVA